eukprot:jgi/Chlat1/3358/Chrsp23S08819
MAVAADDDRSFRKLMQKRLMVDVLETAKLARGSEWKVLVVDDFTIKVISSVAKISDVFDEGVSLVEDLAKKRQPILAEDGIYFITPSPSSVQKLREDFATRPQYRSAHVFFSSPIPRQILSQLKTDGALMSKVATLREVNMELLAVDSQTFLTGQEDAMEVLFGTGVIGSQDYERMISLIATRLSTLFASLQECPDIRYQTSKASGASADGASQRSMTCLRVAQALAERITYFKTSLPTFPQTGSCELLIVDRSIDPVAPVIHEWTYEPMVFDLLELNGNAYKYQVETNAGRMETKEVLLDEHDTMWRDLRHLHIAEHSAAAKPSAKFSASLKLDETTQTLNKKYAASQGAGGASSVKSMQRMVQDLPQYREMRSKLALHVDLASKINAAIRERGMTDVGQLEQDMVFGAAGSKELINLLNTRMDLSTEDKVRLLMVYGITHPEKLDPQKTAQWIKFARITEADMKAVLNLEHLGVPVSKKASAGTFSLSFGKRKAKKVVRKEKAMSETDWQLSRFHSYVQDAVEDLAAGSLSTDDYPYANVRGTNASSALPEPVAKKTSGASVRTQRTGASWAKSKPEDGNSHMRGTSQSAVNLTGKRVVVFIIGGITRAEMGLAHKLTASLGREVIFGSTSLETPSKFITRLRSLTGGGLHDVQL